VSNRVNFTDNTNDNISERIRLMREAIKAAEELDNLTSEELSKISELERKQAQLEKFQLKRIQSARTAASKEKEITASVSEQLSGLSSISSIYSKLTSTQSSHLKLASNQLKTSLRAENADEGKYQLVQSLLGEQSKLNQLQQELASSDPGDVEKQRALRDAYESQLDKLRQQVAVAKALGNITNDQAKILERLTRKSVRNTRIAEQFATVSGDTKKRIESQIEAYKQMENVIRGTLDTIRMTLQTPEAMIVGASVAAGKFASAMGDVNKQTGAFVVSTSLLSFVFDDATATLSQMAKLSGDLDEATFGAQLNTNLLALGMGTSGAEAASLANSFGNLRGMSREVGENMASNVANTALMSNLLPGQVMKDIESNTEAMALYSKGTGQNFADAAIQAAKLGVSIGTTAKMAENLLDFESSIEKELELSAMLGRNINLNRARELAFANDLEGMTKEILNQVGGIDAYNKMDPISRRQTAEALGLSSEELNQMVANQGKLDQISKDYGSNTAKAYQMIKGMAAQFGGPIASGVTFLVGQLIAARMTAAAMSGQGFGGMIRSLFTRGGATPTVPTGPTPPTTPAPQNSVGNQLNQTGNATGGRNMTNLIRGAAAILILSAALYVAAKAFQEFGSVEWESVGKGLVGIAGLAGIAYLLSKVEKDMVQGALAVGILGVALIPFAFAMSLIAGLDWGAVGAAALGLVLFSAAMFGLGALLSGPGAVLFGAGVLGLIALGGAMIVFGAGLMMVGNGINSIISSFSLLVEQVSAMSQLSFLPIFGLAAALAALAVSLGMIGTMGLLALPVLAGLGAVGGLAAGIFGGGEGNEDSSLLSEIKGLRQDLSAGKIAVYMDGQLVTARVANTASKNPVT
jgi:hypothetical protein